MSVIAEGTALFSGERSKVELTRRDGSSILHTARGGGPLSEWSRVPAFRTDGDRASEWRTSRVRRASLRGAGGVRSSRRRFDFRGWKRAADFGWRIEGVV